MIIHGGYAKRLREGEHIEFNDIDLFCTDATLEQLCVMLTGDDYFVQRPACLLPSRALVVLLPRDRSAATVKFDIEIVSDELYAALWDLVDTQKVPSFGLTVGIVSAASDMLIKEVCDFGNPKHLIDAANYRQELEGVNLDDHQIFSGLWAQHISSKYEELERAGLYDKAEKQLTIPEDTTSRIQRSFAEITAS